MIPASEFADRRNRLMATIQSPILLLGHGVRSRNLPMNHLPFRQDSTFWYFTGCDRPGAFVTLVDGRTTLYLPRPSEDDELWHGPQPSFEQLKVQYGVDELKHADELRMDLGHEKWRTLAVADNALNQRAALLLGVPLRYGSHHGDAELVQAVINQRRTKSNAELDELALAASITAKAHKAVMRATHAGASERGLNALFSAVLGLHNAVPGYDTILTQSGEVLHNHHHNQVCETGRLLLLDGGAELCRSGYTADVTRTWPVSGSFTPQQKSAYDAVLAANNASIEACTVGRRYREVHDASSLVLAQWLKDEGLLKVSAEDAVRTGAHALFFPHGVGHLLGMDVHDLENFGDLPAYPPHQERSSQFGTGYLRLDLPLEENWVVTIEPGFYVVPAILNNGALRDRFKDSLDWDKLDAWADFGGIRIEDDVVVSPQGPRVLTQGIPKTVDELEALVGTGSKPEDLLC